MLMISVAQQLLPSCVLEANNLSLFYIDLSHLIYKSIAFKVVMVKYA